MSISSREKLNIALRPFEADTLRRDERIGFLNRIIHNFFGNYLTMWTQTNDSTQTPTAHYIHSIFDTIEETSNESDIDVINTDPSIKPVEIPPGIIGDFGILLANITNYVSTLVGSKIQTDAEKMAVKQYTIAFLLGSIERDIDVLNMKQLSAFIFSMANLFGQDIEPQRIRINEFIQEILDKQTDSAVSERHANDLESVSSIFGDPDQSAVYGQITDASSDVFRVILMYVTFELSDEIPECIMALYLSARQTYPHEDARMYGYFITCLNTLHYIANVVIQQDVRDQIRVYIRQPDFQAQCDKLIAVYTSRANVFEHKALLTRFYINAFDHIKSFADFGEFWDSIVANFAPNALSIELNRYGKNVLAFSDNVQIIQTQLFNAVDPKDPKTKDFRAYEALQTNTQDDFDADVVHTARYMDLNEADIIRVEQLTTAPMDIAILVNVNPEFKQIATAYTNRDDVATNKLSALTCVGNFGHELETRPTLPVFFEVKQLINQIIGQIGGHTSVGKIWPNLMFSLVKLYLENHTAAQTTDHAQFPAKTLQFWNTYSERITEICKGYVKYSDDKNKFNVMRDTVYNSMQTLNSQAIANQAATAQLHELNVRVADAENKRDQLKADVNAYNAERITLSESIAAATSELVANKESKRIVAENLLIERKTLLETQSASMIDELHDLTNKIAGLETEFNAKPEFKPEGNPAIVALQAQYDILVDKTAELDSATQTLAILVVDRDSAALNANAADIDNLYATVIRERQESIISFFAIMRFFLLNYQSFDDASFTDMHDQLTDGCKRLFGFDPALPASPTDETFNIGAFTLPGSKNVYGIPESLTWNSTQIIATNSDAISWEPILPAEYTDSLGHSEYPISPQPALPSPPLPTLPSPLSEADDSPVVETPAPQSDASSPDAPAIPLAQQTPFPQQPDAPTVEFNVCDTAEVYFDRYEDNLIRHNLFFDYEPTFPKTGSSDSFAQIKNMIDVCTSFIRDSQIYYWMTLAEHARARDIIDFLYRSVFGLDSLSDTFHPHRSANTKSLISDSVSNYLENDSHVRGELYDSYEALLAEILYIIQNAQVHQIRDPWLSLNTYAVSKPEKIQGKLYADPRNMISENFMSESVEPHVFAQFANRSVLSKAMYAPTYVGVVTSFDDEPSTAELIDAYTQKLKAVLEEMEFMVRQKFAELGKVEIVNSAPGGTLDPSVVVGLRTHANNSLAQLNADRGQAGFEPISQSRVSQPQQSLSASLLPSAAPQATTSLGLPEDDAELLSTQITAADMTTQSSSYEQMQVNKQLQAKCLLTSAHCSTLQGRIPKSSDVIQKIKQFSDAMQTPLSRGGEPSDLQIRNINVFGLIITEWISARNARLEFKVIPSDWEDVIRTNYIKSHLDLSKDKLNLIITNASAAHEIIRSNPDLSEDEFDLIITNASAAHTLIQPKIDKIDALLAQLPDTVQSTEINNRLLYFPFELRDSAEKVTQISQLMKQMRTVQADIDNEAKNEALALLYYKADDETT